MNMNLHDVFHLWAKASKPVAMVGLIPEDEYNLWVSGVNARVAAINKRIRMS